MTLALVGIAVALNICLVLWKYQRGRTTDALVDASLLVLVAWLFSGSTALLTIGTIGSAIVSIYLLISPVKLGENNG